MLAPENLSESEIQRLCSVEQPTFVAAVVERNL